MPEEADDTADGVDGDEDGSPQELLSPEEAKTVAEAANADPLLFLESNPPQARFYDAVKNPTIGTVTIVALLKGNGVGGTTGFVAAWSAIMFGTANDRFQDVPYGDRWPFPTKSARLVSTREALKDKGPVQRAVAELFPLGEYSQQREAGKGFYSAGYTATGWEWDVFTYDQDPLQAASATKSLILFTEPPPEAMFVECVTRLRGQGLVLIEMTQLDMAEFFDEYVNNGALILDGKKVGEVRVVRGEIEENCRDHHPPHPEDPTVSCGQRPHTSILADMALWPVEEREARRTGASMKRAGRVYSSWCADNELEKLPQYHAERWASGEVLISHVMDPHDRKPWAMAWLATFPNDDVVVFAEWPPFDFHTARESPLNLADDYRAMILDTEASFGKPIRRNGRVADPRFIEAPKAGTDENLRSMLANPCRVCIAKVGPKEARLKCPHKLIYRAAPDSATINHSRVRAAVGDLAHDLRPKLYAMKDACPNFCYGMRHYAYWENKNKIKGLSERPQFVVKDFPDVVRYFYNSRLDLWPTPVTPAEPAQTMQSRSKQNGR